MNPETRSEPATLDDIDGIIELLYLRPPAFWMRKVPRSDLKTFLKYSIKSPRAFLLLTRAPGENIPAGYVFAIVDARRFWAGLALANPGLTLSIMAHRLHRLLDLRQEIKQRAETGDAIAALPAFSWSPSHRGIARIVGLYVRSEHRRRGIAMELYFKLFDVLKENECFKVEEYMGPDYPQFAGKFPEACGWRLQQCSSGGYKLDKAL